MKLFFIYSFLLEFAILGCCFGKQLHKKDNELAFIKKIAANDFQHLLNKNRDALLIDLRTANEYKFCHLKNAVNIDFKSLDFSKQISKQDKTKPVFIYSSKGRRSTKASDIMNQLGFQKIYILDSGIRKWINLNKPLADKETTQDENKGMPITEFLKNINSNQYVLIDFSANWCKPCRKMIPLLDSLEHKMKTNFILLKIDADANQDLVDYKKITAIPYLELYKNGKLIWKHIGYIDEATFLKETKL